MKYEVGEEVWVKCTGTDIYSRGTVVKVNAKTYRVMNDVRGLEGNYKPTSMKKYYLELNL